MSALRAIFFGINLAACLGWIFITARFFAESDRDAFAAVAYTLVALPAVPVGVAEWLLFSRRARWLERPLGLVAGLVGAMAVFASLANVADVVHSSASPDVSFRLVFGGACLAVAAYSFWCCWLRTRRRTLAAPHGFPVHSSS